MMLHRTALRRAAGPALVLALAAAGPAQQAGGEDSGTPNPIHGFEGLYDGIERFANETTDCVILIDPTDPSDLPANLARPDGLWRLRRLHARLTALSGLDCYCFHYTQIRRNTLERPCVKAIVLRAPSPAGMLKCETAREDLWAILRETRIPTIAFCGGFHQVYLAFGGKCGDMRPLKPGETDPNPKYAAGRMKEWGFCKVRALKRDPLFDGLPDEIDVLEQHVSECQRLPDAFEILASSAACRIQAIKHKTRPLYATQFHPEAYEQGHLDGKRILENFFRIAGLPKDNAP